jgi:hypothetical protein
MMIVVPHLNQEVISSGQERFVVLIVVHLSWCGVAPVVSPEVRLPVKR